MLTPVELDLLRRRAVASVRSAVTGRPCPVDPDVDGHPALHQPGAVFVTLRRAGRLRGCIGTLEAAEPLLDAVDDRARAATLRDPRFEPVEERELDDLDVEVSVLGPTEPLEVGSWSALRAVLRPGVDGLVVDDGTHRATFLPAVWDELPGREEFLDRLWEKAGMVPRTWSDRLRVARYSVQHSAAATSPPDRTR